MSVKILFEGHYRALERDFQRLMLDLLKKGAAPLVIASGTHQLRRLRDLLHSASGTKVIGGVVFLPGIRHLAQRFQEVPAPLLAVSHADRTMLALEAMKGLDQDQPLYDLRNNVETAHSLGSFLEDLLERGISPEAYDIASLSLQRERTLTEKTVGEVFGRYARQREERYFSTGDIIMEGNTHAPAGGPMVFYGFYDLSPLQRRFLRRILSRSGDFYWFSPLAVSSQWGDIYARTRNLLDGVGVGSVSRSGERIPMNSFADLFESLPGRSRPLVPSSGFRVTAAAGEFGACREVLERITELNGKEGVPFERIAVVRRKEGGGSLARMAHHEGIPVNEPLKAAMAEIPQGLFVTELLNCMNQDFYHLHLENMFSLGLLRQEYSAHPSEVIRVASRMGIRMGMGKWRDWYSSREEVCGMAEFLRKLDSFAGSLPGRCSPAGYLRRLKEFCEEVLIDPAEPSIRDALFDFRCFRSNSEIGLEQFSRILRIHFQETVVILREGNPHGFRVLNPEKLRGTLQDSVFVMDMEEGIYPRPQVEDPRLSEELRKALQLSLKQQRELEDGFLLRQVGEAASRTFDIIYRQQDESGVEIAPSFLISELIEREIHRKSAVHGSPRHPHPL